MSLVELLVVIAIVAVALALLLPAVQMVRGAAARTKCLNNMHQVGVALHAYHSVHHRLPPGVSYRDGKDPYPFMSWNTRLLPFIEQENLWRQTVEAFAQDRNFLANPPHVGLSMSMPLYTCPSDGRTLWVNNQVRGGTAYLGVEGVDQIRLDGVLYLDSQVRLTDILDGTGNTLMVGERPPSADGVLGWWYAGWGQSKDGSAEMVLSVRETNIGSSAPGYPYGPYEFTPGRISNQCDVFHFWSLHPGGAHFLFADGSARFLRYSANPLLPDLATRAGGEPSNLSD